MAWGVTCRALVFLTRGSSGFASATPGNYKLSVSQSISLLHTTYCNPGVVSVGVSLSYDPFSGHSARVPNFDMVKKCVPNFGMVKKLHF